ncbi:hypothetical protein [Kitasatospora terrestris]|uniref:Histidine kinase/HSP90-like ATPase domain-containing protein n=1 Tax=Kitasatospora terrestris TaxID=258051 RepID=A0ABP9EH04_9ACTN
MRRPEPPQGRTYRVELANTAASIPWAARTARTAFIAWGVPPGRSVLDAVQLIVTELVTNTVRHTRCRDVTLTFTGGGLAVVAEITGGFDGHLTVTADRLAAAGKPIQILVARPAS